MNPDHVAVRYQIVREAREAVPSIDPAAIRGERCVTCTRRVLEARARVRAQVRRDAQRMARSEPDAQRRESIVLQTIDENLPAAIEDRMSLDGLSFGFKTLAVLRRRRIGDSAEQVEEKEVCGVCLDRSAAIHGYERAVKVTPKWQGVADRDHAGGVASSGHGDTAEDRMAAQLDEWTRLRSLIDLVPPFVETDDWVVGVDALLLLQTHVDRADAEAGSLGKAIGDAAVGWKYRRATRFEPRHVERCIALVRHWLRRRLEFPESWRVTEERFVKASETVSTQEAAEILHCSEDHVRRKLVPIWRREGKAIDARAPEAKIPRWRIHREAVRDEHDRRYGAEPERGDDVR